MSKLTQIINSFKDNIAFPWVIVFLFLNLAVRSTGGVNELSRFATMWAMTEQQSFKIDKYLNWTIDWSQNSKGEKFSNKAPGPMLLGFPISFLVDSLAMTYSDAVKDEEGHVLTPLSASLIRITPYLMQVVPFAFLVLILCAYLQKLKVPTLGIHFVALSMTFASTPSIFMNTYFGHGMASIFSLLCFFYLYQKKYFWVGLYFGLTLLSEYAAVVFLPCLIIAMFMQSKNLKNWLGSFALGGVVPGILWSWYHYFCFGSIFQTAIQNENPAFVEQGDKLFGMFSLPDFSIVLKLLFGFERGLLITQPWVLAILVFAFFHKRSKEVNYIFISIFLAFSLLLLMNSSFNGWHGGATSGPRYLSIGIILMSFLAGLIWSDLKKWEIKTLFFLLLISIVTRGFIFATTILAESGVPLYNYMWSFLWDQGPKHALRLAIFFLTLSTTALYIKKRRSWT